MNAAASFWSSAALAASLLLVAPAVAAGGVPLVWHVESFDGRVLDSREADKAVNPASVVKLVTSLRALETLGIEHRFTTTFGATAGRDGVGRDLVVEGGRDPDFHFENAMLVARALREAGVQRVDGDVYVGNGFWMGWERGTVGTETDPRKRRADMGRRLLAAWSPSSWGQAEREAWRSMATRRGWDPASPPAISVRGAVRADDAPAWEPIVEHRSQTLLAILKRFNVFSNNDIERLDATIGPPSSMSSWLEQRWGPDGATTSFATSSGLNRNRMSPRLVVRLLKDLKAWLQQKGKTPGDLMPVLGCGDSTLVHLFPRLHGSSEADGLAGKTGTLNLQDGGVSALAGYLPSGPGLVFFVAAPGAGDRLPKARAAEEDWVRSVLLKHGAPAALSCPAGVSTSDAAAEVRAAGKRAALAGERRGG